MSIKVSITYDMTTGESAEHGDTADHGFYGPGGWKYSIADESFCKRVKAVGQEQALKDMTPEPEVFESTEDAVRFLEHSGPFDGNIEPVAGCLSLYQYEPIQDRAYFEDGESTRLCFHVEASPEIHAAIIEALV